MISLHKTICGLLKWMSNLVTHLSHNMFGMETFSLTYVYIRSIGEHLTYTLDDIGRLGKIYKKD